MTNNKTFTDLVLLLLWIAGVVVAKGFWSTFFAVIFPPYSWYLIIDYLLTLL